MQNSWQLKAEEVLLELSYVCCVLSCSVVSDSLGQEYRSRLPLPTPRNLPDPIESMFPAAPALARGFFTTGTSLVAQTVKNLPEIQETQVWFLGQEDLLEKGMATHSSILAWRNPWTEEPGKRCFPAPLGKPPELSHTSLYLILTRTLGEEEHFQLKILRLLEFTQSCHLEASSLAPQSILIPLNYPHSHRASWNLLFQTFLFLSKHFYF